MELFNPFEDIGKADTVPAQSATIVRALVPTGRCVGDGLKLTHVRGSGKKGGPNTLGVYGRRKGVSKAYSPFTPQSTKSALKQIANMKAPSKPPANRQAASLGPKLRDAKAKQTSSAKIWGNSPTGSTSGRRL